METHFPCKDPAKVYQSMLELTKEMNPSWSEELVQSVVVQGLIHEFEDYQLDFYFHDYCLQNQNTAKKVA